MLGENEKTEAGDAAGNGAATTRSAGYSSPSIIARRHRILNETRRMIGEVGIANLSMDDVAKRANVAKRTLYNAFQSKEHLIALAISKYFEDYASKIDYSTEDATLEWMIERLVVVARRNLSIRNYTRALMNIYFSANVDQEIRQAIHEIASKSHEPWIMELSRKGELQPWIDPEDLITMLVRLRYATAQAWAEGFMSDDELVIELLRSFFTLMAGATQDSARDGIVQLLADLENHPLLQQG